MNRRSDTRLFITIFLILLLLAVGWVIFLYIRNNKEINTYAPSEGEQVQLTIPPSGNLPQTEEDSTLASIGNETSKIGENLPESETTHRKKSPAADTVAIGSQTDIDTKFSFENALFIGDSRTDGLFINTGLTEATFYALRGLSVDNIYTEKFIQQEDNSQKLTVIEALKDTSWRKIYIMLGINELGWTYDDMFIDQYTKLIQDIQTLQPQTEIIVQSLLPVTKEKSDSDDIYNNERIYHYNELIVAMAKELDVTYANLIPAIAGEDGALPKEGSSDGIHLTKSYYLKWLDYLIEQKI